MWYSTRGLQMLICGVIVEGDTPGQTNSPPPRSMSDCQSPSSRARPPSRLFAELYKLAQDR